MLKSTYRLVVFVTLTGALLSFSNASEMDVDLMQSMEDAQKNLSSNISLGNAKAALADAKELEQKFVEVEAFYLKKGNATDGVNWSKESKELAGVVVAQALAKKDFDTASRSSVVLAKTCKACHETYKSQQ
jgi:cytochrome c556